MKRFRTVFISLSLLLSIISIPSHATVVFEMTDLNGQKSRIIGDFVHVGDRLFFETANIRYEVAMNNRLAPGTRISFIAASPRTTRGAEMLAGTAWTEHSSRTVRQEASAPSATAQASFLNQGRMKALLNAAAGALGVCLVYEIVSSLATAKQDSLKNKEGAA